MAARPARTIWRDFGALPGGFGFCPTQTAWDLTIRRFGIKQAEYPQGPTALTTLFRHKSTREMAVVVTMGEPMDRRPANSVVGLLTHEATHVWQYLLEDIGEVQPSREFEAYTLQRITMGLLAGYNSTRRKILRG